MNILAIDLGSYSIKVAIVKAHAGRLDLLSQSSVGTAGIRHGRVVNMNTACQSIINAIEKVKENISVRIDKTIVSINAAYLKSYSSRSKLVLEGDATITLADIEKALKNAYNQTAIDHNEVALHVLPWRFYASNGTIVEDPLGMCASAFALEAHIVAIEQNDLSNLRRILDLAGLRDYELVAGVYASSIYALRDDEKDRCTAIVDIGHDICQLAIYKQNSIAWLESLCFGSGRIGDDLVTILQIPEDIARHIKITHERFEGNENISIAMPNGEEIVKNVDIIRNIIGSRTGEMLDASSGVLRRSDYGAEYANVVFVGGTFNNQQIVDRSRAYFDNKPVRVHTEANPCFNPSDCAALNLPEFACLFGLCMYGAGYHTNYELNVNAQLKTHQKTNPFYEEEDASELEPEAMELNLAHSLENYDSAKPAGLFAYLARVKDTILDKLTRLF